MSYARFICRHHASDIEIGWHLLWLMAHFPRLAFCCAVSGSRRLPSGEIASMIFGLVVARRVRPEYPHGACANNDAKRQDQRQHHDRRGGFEQRLFESLMTSPGRAGHTSGGLVKETEEGARRRAVISMRSVSRKARWPSKEIDGSGWPRRWEASTMSRDSLAGVRYSPSM